MKTILFVCRQNAGRSQMSEALFTRAVGGRYQALRIQVLLAELDAIADPG